MKGLCKNNILAVWINAKIFFIFMAIMGVMVAIVPEQTLLMYFILIGIVGFTIMAATATGNEFSSKWAKYKLTLPVKRADIVKSLYLNQLLWLSIGVLFVGGIILLAALWHHLPLAQLAGLGNLFVLGISISLFLGALFIPLIYLVGEDKIVVFLLIALLCAVALAALLFNLANAAPLLGAILLLTSALLLFALSYPLTVRIFRRKEY